MSSDGEATGDPVASGATRVLVVDDQELFRRGLMLVLAGEDDLEVVGDAADGPTALGMVVERTPDVVLLDVRMPGMSGLETCAAARTIAPQTRIIMLTSSDDESDLYASVKAGASGYLLKDASIDQVAEAVRLVADGQSLINPAMAAKLLEEFKLISQQRPEEPPGPRLTGRELEVLKEVARGLNNRQIATELFISEHTVKNHIRNILEKLQLHSRVEAVMYAVRQKLLDV
ncbi:response regulator [Solicola gregarius]|uniref:Response regulator transcription factor n=1 Tax=Solicola gregarius TaxID=2908642 RepID=A0AA46YJY0_9ACTN|nr:response regulator transcription factor [Solicola gregarius]UYM04049.1 response regulator transcription factor [Solicola gregarius]